jgi:hypothetical protein
VTWKDSANKSGRSFVNSSSSASAGGQEEQLSDVNSSTTSGLATAGVGAALAITNARADSFCIAGIENIP